jgi:FlaA1/EpsC-like NDP-sugar epimerase
MGRPVRLGDLAARLLSLEEAAGYEAVPIEVVGLRPGEKRTETLQDPRLSFVRTIDRRIRVARDPDVSPSELALVVSRLRRAFVRADDGGALDVLAAAVHGFAPSRQAIAAAGVRPASQKSRQIAPVLRRKRPAA